MSDTATYPARPEPQWVNYVTLMDDQPTMISVDSSWIEALCYGDAETLLELKIAMKHLPKGEMVSRDELPALQELAEALEAEIPSEYAYLAARSYGGGQMTLYIYTPHPEDVTAILSDVLDESGYDFDSQTTQDPEWEFYTGQLFPDDVVWQNITNSQILEELENHGDSGKIARPLTHMAHFIDRETAVEFASMLEDIGYDLGEFTDLEPEDGDENIEGYTLCVEFSREDAPSDINQVTSQLIPLAAEVQGRYAGWLTSVVVDSTPKGDEYDDDEGWEDEEE